MTLGELRGLLADSIKSCDSLGNDALRDLRPDSEYAHILFKVFNVQLENLKAILGLLDGRCYKTCLIAMRSVFESYFFYRLMIDGKRYREWQSYIVESKSGSPLAEVRRKILDNWRKEKSAGNPTFQDAIDFGRGDTDNVVRIKWELEGLFEATDTEKKGEALPRFYFAYIEYEPQVHHLAELATVSLGYLDEETQKSQQAQNAELYREYLRPASIVENLRLNSLLTSEQEDRFWVHYNFLSNFTHPTKEGDRDETDYQSKYHLNEARLDKAMQEIILLYGCSLLQYCLESTVNLFTRLNNSDWHSKYDGIIRKLKEATKDFWFIFNEPNDQDREYSKQMKEIAVALGQAKANVDILYYPDPIDRHLRAFRA